PANPNDEPWLSDSVINGLIEAVVNVNLNSIFSRRPVSRQRQVAAHLILERVGGVVDGLDLLFLFTSHVYCLPDKRDFGPLLCFVQLNYAVNRAVTRRKRLGFFSGLTVVVFGHEDSFHKDVAARPARRRRGCSVFVCIPV